MMTESKNSKIGLKHRVILCLLLFEVVMSIAATASAEVGNKTLNWVQKDKRRLLRAIYNVGNLDRTIKFYTECFGLRLLRKKDTLNYSKAVLGFGPQDSKFVLELVYKHGVDKYVIGTGFGHFGITTEDVYTMVETVRRRGGIITREPGANEGGTTVFAFVQDPDGYSFELTQRNSTPESLDQVMLHVANLNQSIDFYKKALGMKLLLYYDSPQDKFSIAMMGYGEDRLETTVLELRYNYGVTEYTKGNGYSHVSISTEDVYKSALAIELVTQELGGKITQPPGPVPGSNTKITAFLDPDGWKMVLVNKEDS